MIETDAERQLLNVLREQHKPATLDVVEPFLRAVREQAAESATPMPLPPGTPDSVLLAWRAVDNLLNALLNLDDRRVSPALLGKIDVGADENPGFCLTYVAGDFIGFRDQCAAMSCVADSRARHFHVAAFDSLPGEPGGVVFEVRDVTAEVNAAHGTDPASSEFAAYADMLDGTIRDERIEWPKHLRALNRRR